MREFEQKKKIKSRLYSKITIIILGLIFLLLAKACFSVYQKQRDTKEKLTRAEAALTELSDRRTNLQEETARLQSSEGIEEEIRRKFQVSKEGEKVIVIVDDQKDQNMPATSTSFFSKVKDVIINLIK